MKAEDGMDVRNYGGLDDIMCLGLDLAELLAALGLADALADHMLCGLGSNAAKISGLLYVHDDGVGLDAEL